MFLSLNKIEILDGKRNETKKIVFENHVYHHDYRYLNIFRCSQRCSANKSTVTLIMEENHEDFHVEGMHNHATLLRTKHCERRLSVFLAKLSILRRTSCAQLVWCKYELLHVLLFDKGRWCHKSCFVKRKMVQKACELWFPYCFLTDSTEFFL